MDGNTEPVDLSQEATRTISTPAAGHSPFAGAQWGHLRLVEEIGRGGFGSVYRAWDSILEREVALKFFSSLPEGADLHTEGRQLAKLRHSNVVQVYGVAEHDGRAALWMEFIHGRTLSRLVREQGPLAAHEATALTLEVCRAVSAVHSAGLVHRDIKAQNVMREDGGRIVLMDFGLTAPQSDTVGLAGTPVCMAPELLDGRPATAQSDVYALGVMLYFLVTGRYPYEAPDSADLVRQIRERRMKLLADVRQDLPHDFIAAVEKAMSVRREDRFATAGELAKALAAADRMALPPRRRMAKLWVAAAACLLVAAGGWIFRQQLVPASSGPHFPTVAVLPFENLTGDPRNDYIGNGIGEEIADWLGKSKALLVISRSSSEQFRGAHEPATAIGKKLHADWLFSGSVRRNGSRVRVSVQLVQASDGSQRFSDTYEYEVNQPFALEEQIGGSLASVLNLRLYPNQLEKLSPEARELYWQAEEESQHQSPQSLRVAAQDMEKVAQMAPDNPDPVLNLSWIYLSLATVAGGTKDDSSKANAYIRQALHLAPDSVVAHSMLAWFKCRIEWDWIGAEQEYRLCLRIGERGSFSYAGLLLDEGRINEARVQLDLDLAQDPLSYQIPHIRSLLELFAGNLNPAERDNDIAIQLMPKNPTRLWRRGQIRSLLGRHTEAIQDLRQAVEMTGSRIYQGALGWAYVRAGQPAEARKILAQITADPSVSAVEPARIYAGLGEREAALDWLEKACAEHDPVLDTVWMDPFWKPLRGHPRYQAVVAKVFPGVRLMPPPD